MAYERGDRRYGGDYRYGGGNRWRDRERGSRYEGDHDRGAGSWAGRRYGDEEERGLLDRAGDEVRSWFGDEEAERRREMDQRRYEREQGYGGGWSDREREDRGYYGSDYDRSRSGYTRGNIGQGVYGIDYDRPGPHASETWGGSGFGGDYDRGRRFDRIDPGQVGTHGAHPMSAPGGAVYGAGYGVGTYGYRSSARESAALGGRGATTGDLHDRHYSEWRNRQIESLDRDYDEYRREHQSQFDREFAGWREKRQGQRASLGRVSEHMEVVGSDGEHIGTVDCVKGDRIMLTKSDESAGGRHHSIPCGWIESVDDKVTVNKSAEEATMLWRDEERNRALFEREDQGSEGPHMLNRSFSGTYER